MIVLLEKTEAAGEAMTDTLTLPYEQRQKSRQRVTLDSGREAALLLPPGSVLRTGECLRSDTGDAWVRVRAAAETVSTAHTDDLLLLARACYHLGNRHVPVQIGVHTVRYLHDHVLDDMLRGLGLEVWMERAPFEPEAGAYSGQGHRHDHSH